MSITNVFKIIDKYELNKSNRSISAPVELLELNNERCKSISEEAGVYFIIVPDGMKVKIKESSKDWHYCKNILNDKYSNCKDKELVYIGKAEGRKGLRQRIRQYLAFGFGNGKNHRGGRAVWQIDNYESLLLICVVGEDASGLEHNLLEKYKKNNSDTLPLANWRL